jgi:hypothetical protein
VVVVFATGVALLMLLVAVVVDVVAEVLALVATLVTVWWSTLTTRW